MTNPGPATTVTQSQVATLTPVNALGPTVPGQAGNALRLLAVVRGMSFNAVGDFSTGIINSTSWAPSSVVVANGQVSGVGGSIATAALGVFTAAAGGGTAILSATTLSNNSALNSSIVTATTVVNLAFTGSTVFFRCTTALANATADVFLYGYDQS